MPGMRDIKRRIRSVKSTQQITRAMKMVSAAKLRKNQDKLINYRPFGESHRQMIGRILARSENVSHPLLTEHEGQRLVVLMTSDKGLCGSFNHHIIRMTEDALKAGNKDNTAIFAIGKKGRDYFRKRKYNIWKYIPMATKDDLLDNAYQIGDDIIPAFLSGEFGRVDVNYSHFQSALIQHARSESLIPLASIPFEEEFPRQYSFEPSSIAVLEVLLPLAIKLSIYRCLLETTTAEHGARMTAMDSATNNAVDMIASLTLSYNKARQAAITKEIIEVVSGADALT